MLVFPITYVIVYVTTYIFLSNYISDCVFIISYVVVHITIFVLLPLSDYSSFICTKG